ncbi:MAG TPA: hypothetical protein VFX79_03610 [Candidatus Saccharimonadales bacterium]|nr:hypothetical protein [Candidatus Saccharimonadales bacterium]
MTRIYALEYRAAFLAEERSKTYKRYDARVPQVKMLICAKNDLQNQALLGLERRGA